MTQVVYTKKAYQDAKRTPPKDRTEEQHVLCLIDFRQGPNPIIRLGSGSHVVIRTGMLIEADAKGSIGIVLDKEPEEKSEDEKPPETEPSDESETEKNEESLSADEFFKKN